MPDNPDILDVMIIGAGPAGLTAAALVAEAGLRCLTIDPMGPGGQLMNLGRLHDCPDLPEGTTGPDLLGLLVERATAAGAEMGFGEARSLERVRGGEWTVATDDETWRAHAVVIATGLSRGTTLVAGEARFEGRGLSHCANCDGPLYKDQPVVVHGSGRWALEEAIELSAMASHVTLVRDVNNSAQPPDDPAPERLAWARSRANLTILDGRVAALVGEDALSAVDVETRAGLDTVSARAIFLLANRTGASDWTKLHGIGFDGRPYGIRSDGRLATDRSTTAVAIGLFAAGDVVDGNRESIADAIAEGKEAGQNAVEWLRRRRSGG